MKIVPSAIKKKMTSTYSFYMQIYLPINLLNNHLLDSEGRASISWRELIIGETIRCSKDLWTVLRTKIL